MKLKKPTRRSVTSCVGHGVVGHQRLAPIRRQAGLAQDLDEAQARQRRVARRLDDHRAACGDGRPHLMHDQVQRMVEGAHRHDHADGLALRERDAPGRRGVDVHRDDMARFRAQQLGAVEHAIDRARDLHARIEQRLAALARRFERQRLGLLLPSAPRPCAGSGSGATGPARRRGRGTGARPWPVPALPAPRRPCRRWRSAHHRMALELPS